MTRISVLFLGTLLLSSLKAYCQLNVYQNDKGQVLTTVDVYGSARINATAYNKVTYLGSPFLTYPVWQQGTVQLDRSGKTIRCQLAYNLASAEVLCQFDGDSTIKTITPELFTINGTEFVRQQNTLLGNDYRLYTTVLHSGSTQLLESKTKQLEAMNSAELVENAHNRDLNIQSIYRVKSNYYIRKGDARAELISLSRKSLLAVFHDQSEKMAVKIPNRALTVFDVIDLINYYDSLMVVVRKGNYPLSQNPLFTQTLRDKITYPNWVGSQGIYGRVYAGFDIDSLGRIKNITILSPDNVGFGFVQEVQKALAKVPDLNPTYAGKYVLPVAFTYINSSAKGSRRVPINHLPDERVGNRTVLDEFTVPYTVNKQDLTSKEVWGYYR